MVLLMFSRSKGKVELKNDIFWTILGIEQQGPGILGHGYFKV
jgi:hypothetical protein